MRQVTCRPLHKRSASPCPRVNDVIVAGAAFFEVSIADLTGPSRVRPLVWFRQATMAAARSTTWETYSAIAWAFGRDHTTVIHAVEQATTKPEVVRLTRALVSHLEGRS